MDLAAFMEPVERALRATRAKVLAAYRGETGDERYKADGSPVTDLDEELEGDLGRALMSIEGSFGVIGEESGEMRAGSPAWHLDPLDGTANFARRIPVFGSQLALLDGIEPLFAAVYAPLTDEFTWAARGLGTWHEGRRARVQNREPKHAVVDIDYARSGLFIDRPALLPAVRRGSYKLRALGSVAIHLRDVAVGAADAYLGGRRHASPLHDLAPGALLIREAGGLVTDGRGNDALLERTALVAGAQAVHDWICGLLETV